MANSRTAVFLLICLAALSGEASSDRRGRTYTVHAEIARLVEPILDVRADSQGCHDRDESFQEADKLLGTILGLRTLPSDEALVVLLYFYIGESSYGDIIHEITKRGRRMVPYLRRYRNTAPAFANRAYPPCLFVESGTRVDSFDEAIKAIGARRIIGED